MTLTITATDASGDWPRIQLNVTSSPSVSDLLQVYRTHEDGTTHRVLLESNATLLGSYSGFDNLMPFNQQVTYTATAGGVTSAPSGLASVWSGQTWLMSSTDPALSLPVTLVGPPPSLTRASRASRYQVLGRKLPTHRTDYPRAGYTGTLQVLCPGREDEAVLTALLDDNFPILVNSSSYASDLMGWMWIAAGDVVTAPPTAVKVTSEALVSFTFEETTQPDTDQDAIWTYNDLVAEAAVSYPTYADLATAGFADYNALRLRAR